MIIHRTSKGPKYILLALAKAIPFISVAEMKCEKKMNGTTLENLYITKATCGLG